MNKKTLSNIIFLIAVNIVIKPFWLFGIDRVVQNKLGEEIFGIYFVLFNFSMLYQIVLDFGLQQYNSRIIAQDNQKLNSNFFNFLISKLGLAMLYMAFVIPTFFILGYSWENFGQLILLLLVNQILISFIFYLRSNLAGLHRFKLDSLFSVLDKGIMIFLGGSILYFNFLNIPLTIFNFVLIQTIAFLINAILLLFVVGKIASPFQVKLNFKLIKKTAAESAPFALSIFLMSIYLRMDAIMIERLLGKTGAYEAGIYAQSFRIIDALNMIGILFANILLPTYSKLLKDEEPLSRLMKQSSLLMLVIIIPVALIGMVKSEFIIQLLYVNSSSYSAGILSILLVSFLAYNLMHIYSSMLTAAKQLKQLNLIFLFGILFNLVANFIFIPKLGAKGAAVTTAVSESFVLLLIVLLAVKFVKAKKA